MVKSPQTRSPALCLTCRHYDAGEFGEYGTLLSGPSCWLNVYFPTRSGFCWRYQPRGRHGGPGAPVSHSATPPMVPCMPLAMLRWRWERSMFFATPLYMMGLDSLEGA